MVKSSNLDWQLLETKKGLGGESSNLSSTYMFILTSVHPFSSKRMAPHSGGAFRVSPNPQMRKQ
jgi:hypothetical protein